MVSFSISLILCDERLAKSFPDWTWCCFSASRGAITASVGWPTSAPSDAQLT